MMTEPEIMARGGGQQFANKYPVFQTNVKLIGNFDFDLKCVQDKFKNYFRLCDDLMCADCCKTFKKTFIKLDKMS